jgi:transketolase
LIATGSEVGVAEEAATILRKSGRRIRVVSMPCVDLFLRQSESDREAILPKGVRRATFELGVTLPWAAIAGSDGILIGLDDFGASAPMERLAEEYKVTPAHVAARIQSAL